MRLTKEQREKVKQALIKKHGLNEGFIDYLFGKRLVKKLSNDKEFLKIAKRLDSNMSDMHKKVADMKKNGEPIPDLYKHILGKSYKG